MARSKKLDKKKMQRIPFTRPLLASRSILFVFWIVCVLIALSSSSYHGNVLPVIVSAEETDVRREGKNQTDHSIASTASDNATNSIYSSFGMVVENSIMCGVCYNVIANSIVQVQTYMRAKNISSVSLEEIEELLEGICNPYHVSGAWIRKVRFALEKENENVTDSPIHLEMVQHLTYHVRCKRTCQTVTDACQYLAEEKNVFHNLSREILHGLSMGENLIDNVELHKQMRATFCDDIFECQSIDTLVGRMTKMLNQRPHSKLRRELESDTAEYVRDEVEVESLFSRTEGLLTQLDDEDVERLRATSEDGFYHFVEEMMDAKEREDKEKKEREEKENGNSKEEIKKSASPSNRDADL